MNPQALRQLLEELAGGQTTVDQVLARLATLPFEQLDFACLDHHRALRCGFPEVVFGQGKTAEQIEVLFTKLASVGGNVLATRVGREAAERIVRRFPQATYHEAARALTLRQTPAPATAAGLIALVCAGSSDLPVRA